MPSTVDARSLRAGQAGVRALVVRDLTAFVNALDGSRPEQARDALLAFTPALVATYGQIAATMAADWYDLLRAEINIPGRFRAVDTVPDETVAVVETVRRAAGVLFTDDPSPLLTSLQGPLGKYALSGSRATILASTSADPRASGWTRVTRAGACTFCKALAGRGAVYRRESVDFAAHGHCNCAAAPSWDPDAPEVDAQAYAASMRTSLMSDRQRQLHRARTRAWLADTT